MTRCTVGWWLVRSTGNRWRCRRSKCYWWWCIRSLYMAAITLWHNHYALRAAAALLLQNKLLNLTKCSKILANNISSNNSSSAHLQRNFSAMCTQVDVDGPSIVTSVHVDVGVGPWSIQSCLACFRWGPSSSVCCWVNWVCLKTGTWINIMLLWWQ